MPLPSSGLTEVDRLIMKTAERGLVFPPDVKRYQLLAWAAEALELQRRDPADFERDGLSRITRQHFPTVNP